MHKIGKNISRKVPFVESDRLPVDLFLFSNLCISTHVLTEDVVYREVTADNCLLSRRLLMKTNRLPRWAEAFFPGGMSRSVYIIEDSIVDPVSRSLTTYTWNLNHTKLMVSHFQQWQSASSRLCSLILIFMLFRTLPDREHALWEVYCDRQINALCLLFNQPKSSYLICILRQLTSR